MALNFFTILLIIIIIALIILYAVGKISGTTLFIIILILIILILLIPGLIGAATIGFLGRSCMNNNCSVVKLPLDIKPIGQYSHNETLYSVGMNR